MEKGLCFGCLVKGHTSTKCLQRKKYKICEGRHPTSLHRQIIANKGVVVSLHVRSTYLPVSGCKLHVVPVLVTWGTKTVKTNAFLDSGSTHSFCSHSLLRQLDYNLEETATINLTTIQTQTRLPSYIARGMKIKDLTENTCLPLPPLLTLDEIPVHQNDIQSRVHEFKYLRDQGVNIQEIEGEVGLLLGNNAALAMEPLEIVNSENGGPFAVRTRFGWILSGVGDLTSSNVNSILATTDWEKINEMNGTLATEEKGPSVEDRDWRVQVDASCSRTEDGHFQIDLPDNNPEGKQVTATACSALTDAAAEPHPIRKLINHYSSWWRLTRALARLLRLKSRLRGKQDSIGDIQMKELLEAENIILSHEQDSSFQQEKVDLSTGLLRRNSDIYRLDPEIHNSMLRVGGRLENSPLSYFVKHPIILPTKGRVTDMLIQKVHAELEHGGREHVLLELRRKLLVVKGYSAVRRVLSGCLQCKRIRQPAERPPLIYTGTDLFGPFFTTRGRSQIKMYGVIFSCLSTRAVHLEVTSSISTDSFICTFRRFLARRGAVKMKDDSLSKTHWRQAQYLAEQFWARWKKSHVPLLQERAVDQRSKRNLMVGDVVVLVDKSGPRGNWPFGRIKELKISSDRLVRSATVYTGGKTLNRPVNKMVLVVPATNQ